MKTVAEVLEVSLSNLHDRVNGSAKPRRGYYKAQDAVVLCRASRRWWRSARPMDTAELRPC